MGRVTRIKLVAQVAHRELFPELIPISEEIRREFRKNFYLRHLRHWPAIRPHLTDADLIGGLEALDHYGPVDDKNFDLVKWGGAARGVWRS